MERINLSVERPFSDLITATIFFLKQELVPFIRAFVVIGFPGILLVMFFMKDLLIETLSFSINPEEMASPGALSGVFVRSLLTMCFTMVMMMWVQLFSIAYLRVYWDHYRSGNLERIMINEVFQVMLRKIGVYILWSMFYGLLVVVGMCFLLVPGIYLAIALTFGTYLIILRDNGLGKIITEAMSLIKNNWWRTLGYIIVLQLLVSVIAFVFNIPYLGLTIFSTLTGEMPGGYALTFALLLSYLGQYTLYTVVFIGIGMLFFSRLEEMEHTTLLNKIDQLGAQPGKSADEMGH